MKRFIIPFTLMAGLLFTACGNAPENAEEAVVSDETAQAAEATVDATVYTVDTAESVIKWEGYKPGKYGHNGIIKVQSGEFSMDEDEPVSGSFVIDMNSLEDLDLEDPAKKAKLENHLKSADFFEVDKYPTGKFELTNVSKADGMDDATYRVTGNLTLRDITKSIEIPATVTTAEDGIVTVSTPEFIINRTDWKVNYGSGIIGTVQDKIIADDVKLMITLVGNARSEEAPVAEDQEL